MIVRPCKCGTTIFFARTPAGKAMPLNAVEVTTQDPKLPVYSEHGVLVEAELGKYRRGYVAHWVTCPNRDEFRKAQSKGAKA